MGAALMFAFTLGTSPVFFIVAYLTTELGSRLEKFFMRFVAVVVLKNIGSGSDDAGTDADLEREEDSREVRGIAAAAGADA